MSTHAPKQLARAAEFYDSSPTGQYDDLAAHALRCHAELLAACKEAAHWIDGCGAEGSSEVIRNLDAAIAKAEGRG